MSQIESSTIVRAVKLVGLMYRGEPMTTQQVADHLGIAWSSAKYLIEMASIEIPLYQDDSSKAWQILRDSDNHK